MAKATDAQIAALRAHVARWSGGFVDLNRELLTTLDAMRDELAELRSGCAK